MQPETNCIPCMAIFHATDLGLVRGGREAIAAPLTGIQKHFGLSAVKTYYSTEKRYLSFPHGLSKDENTHVPHGLI